MLPGDEIINEGGMKSTTKLSKAAKRKAGLLDDARRRLVETGTRNRLIHVNRENKRANALNIINERSLDIFDILRRKSKRMRFKATGDEKTLDDNEIQLADNDEDDFDEARYRDLFLETPLGPEGLQRRLLRLFSDARTAEEEQGVNILFLALGFMTWFEETNSDVQRSAPLILLPVELVRNERGSSFSIRCRDDDIVTNLPLQERLRTDFGIKFPEIDDSEEWTPEEYYVQVSDSIAEQPRWSIDRNGIQLGFFSFSKLLMLRDLEPENWPAASLADNKLVGGLLEDGFEPKPPLFGPKDLLDDKLDPADIVQVVDADSSQTKVIEEVRSGRNLVVQGPPGTGKSQTITNIIASAVHDGRKVLFVAEKMAALEVVHGRLVKTGLQDICLEVHSKKTNKKAVLQELGRTLSAGLSVPALPDPPKELRLSRDRLNEIADILHADVSGQDYSPFDVMAEIVNYIGQEVPPPIIKIESFQKLTKNESDNVAKAISEYVEVLKKAGAPKDHPFSGTAALELQPPDLQRLETLFAAALADLQRNEECLVELSSLLTRKLPRTFAEVEQEREIIFLAGKASPDVKHSIEVFFKNKNNSVFFDGLQAGRSWVEAKKEVEDKFLAAVWSAPLVDIRAKLSRGVTSFWSRWFGGYRAASGELQTFLIGDLPKVPAERLALIDKVLSVQRMRSDLAQYEDMLSDALSNQWHGEKTDFIGLVDNADWFKAVVQKDQTINLETIIKLIDLGTEANPTAERISKLSVNVTESVSAVMNALKWQDVGGPTLQERTFLDLQEWVGTMRREIGRYSEWVTLSVRRDALVKADLIELLDVLDSGKIHADEAVREFRYALAESRWIYTRKMLPALAELTHLDRHQLVKKFARLDRQRLSDSQSLIRAKHLGQLPKGASGEMGYILGEIGKKRGHKSIRKLMQSAGKMVQRIKPVFLMSPVSVAQFLPPGTVKFDLLVIDEASQVRPEDALGAVARADQIVVVGDQKQLPPTSFFDRLADTTPEDEDENEEMEGMVPAIARATELESILTLCEARGLKSSILAWHYRSRDPSLIWVSNQEFYEGRLILPPSPLQNDTEYGLSFVRVPGVYSSRSQGGGRPRTNRIEAEHIVNVLARYAREWPSFSVGVVAFSKAQSDMITEVLEIRRRKDTYLDKYLRADKIEDVFIKNIENVQGDERDIILISVGYGPHEANAKLSTMQFGPVNAEGGERRLNVLFSRARVRCEVFASFDPGDIDPSRASRDGPRVLKSYLEFAKNGQLDQQLTEADEGDDLLFEEDVAKVIRSLGYLADIKLGSEGFRIDIGVRHPDRPETYVMAVECDGADWHGSLWARERDRLRQDILENLGWHFHRIWSTDWFHRRASEVKRLSKALDSVKVSYVETVRLTGSNSGKLNVPEENEITVPEIDPEVLQKGITAPSYRMSNLKAPKKVEPQELKPTEMAELITQIIEIEGPIHFDEIARRVASIFDKSRAGTRIKESVKVGLKNIQRTTQALIVEEDFWMTRSQKETVPVRDRSEAKGPIAKSDNLSSLEILAAGKLIRKESGSMELPEMVKAVAKLLGFSRVVGDLKSRLQKVLSQLY